MPYSNLTFQVQPGLRFKENDFVTLYGSDVAPTTTTTTTASGSYTLVGFGTKVLGNGSCGSIGNTPDIYLSSTDFAKYLSNGGCFSDGTGPNTISVIRNSDGTPISGTFIFVYYGGSCSTTTFKSINGSITIEAQQC